MRNFSIKELESLSGINAPTIRVWEKRYAVLKPQRSQANIRRYSVDELSMILNLSLLNSNKIKISRLANMCDEELYQCLNQLRSEKDRLCQAVNALIIYMYQMDIDAFEAQLDECFLTWPVETVVQDIVFPFLKKVNLLCRGNRLNEEHLVVTAIRKKLHWSIEKVAISENNGKTILLFLFGENQLDLLLLYFYYLLKKSGWKVIYMGVDISLQNLESILPSRNPEYVLTYVSKKHYVLLDPLAEKVKSITPEPTVLLVNSEGDTGTKKKCHNIMEMSCAEVISLLMPSG